jgi:hypothetical protein
MAISKDAIMQKTQYGIRVYAHILRKYYPNTSVLELSGKTCKATFNPFNEGKPTLKIQLVNNLAVHIDIEKAIEDGDFIHFANLHYNLRENELFEKLNTEMHLKIGENFNFYENNNLVQEVQETKKTHIPSFSYFRAPISNVNPLKEISLLKTYNLIKGNDLEKVTSTLRRIADKTEARKFKASNFDYVTFSGLFSKRNDNSLKRHSNLITIDLDHLENLNQTKEILLNDESLETELLFTSPSGDGLKWIVKIDLTTVTHQDYFKAISNYLSKTYNLMIDQSGKDISRACFLAHDPNAYLNSKYL